jgi:uncharacterized protein YegL
MRKLPVYFLIDTSGSMRGEKIQSVIDGLKSVVDFLMSNPIAIETVHLSTITFDNQAKVSVPLTEIMNFTTPTLSVDKGLTSLGDALSLLSKQITKDVVLQTSVKKGDWRPLVFIMTDGEPTDDWEKGLNELKKKSVEIIACAIGSDCDTFILKKITPNVVEMVNFSAPIFNDFFRWISVSIGQSSQQIETYSPLDNLPQGISLVKGEGKKLTQNDPIYNQKRLQRAINLDKFGNPNGAEYDLVKDNAFEGVSIAVLHLYTGEGFDFSLPTKALKEKGFQIIRWANQIPTIAEFKEKLSKVFQLWIISDRQSRIPETHLNEIERFFNEGKGLYLWGDNDPYFYDINIISQRLLKINLSGNDMGDQVINLSSKNTRGINRNHPINFGIEYIYEGITISSIGQKNIDFLNPILFSSVDKLVVSSYEKDGKRLVIDGGFTRLFINWDTAGTARYVKNAAAWLTNYERFGSQIFQQS